MSEKSSGYSPPFLAFASDAKDLDILKAFALKQGWQESCVLQGDIKTAAEYLKNHASPTLLLVEMTSQATAQVELNQLAEVCDPDTKVIIIGNINEYSFYCWLTEIGIFSYLLRPLTPAMLDGAYEKSNIKPGTGAKLERAPGKVVSVVGTRGGAGGSSIALNLAGIIADLSKKNIALIDLDPQDGSISLMLDLEPAKGFREALEKPDRIDSLFIDRVMIKPHKHLSLLSSEEPLHEQVHYHEQTPELLLKELKAKYDLILLDSSRANNGFTRQCLMLSDNIVLVTEFTLTGLRDTLRLGDMMRDQMKLKQPVVLANRVGHAAKFEMKQGDFEKGIGSKVDYVVPYAPELFMQVSTDVPSIKFKEHSALKALYKLAESLEPSAKTLLATVKEKKSFFSGKKKPAPPVAQQTPPKKG